MNDLMFVMLGLAWIVTGLTVGYILGASDTVSKSELRRNGYFVVRHEETHGEFHTNWVEVIHK